MTTTAHNKRHIRYGATRTPTSEPASQRFSLYRELHPEMYKGERKKTTTKPRRIPNMQEAGSIFLNQLDSLLQSGVTGTAAELATLVGFSSTSVRRALKGGKIAVRVVDHKLINSNKTAVWGK